MADSLKKADQIVSKTYTKLVLLLNDARTPQDSTRAQAAKTDKWFNLEVPDTDLFKEHLKLYRSVSASQPPPIPFTVQVLLSIPELGNSSQVLVYKTPDLSLVRVDPTPKHIVLEEWTMDFRQTSSSQLWAMDDDDGGPVAPPTIYKHGISLFRSMFSLLRILPSWRLFPRMRRRNGVSRHLNLTMHLRLKDENYGVLPFDAPLAPNSRPIAHETHSFPSIPHPSGALTLSVQYLSNPNFQLVELESLLSSRFMTEASAFTPTLAAQPSYQNSPGSLPIRISLPQSPPSSIADRFVLPRSPVTQTPSPITFPTPPSPRNVPVTLPNNAIVASSSGSSTRNDGSESPAAVGVAARYSRDGKSTSSGADLPSAPVGMPMRRPNVNPFKSSNLSSGSPSFRNASPLSSAGLPTQSKSNAPTSPVGVDYKPSPPYTPFAPSSLGDRKSTTSNEAEDSPKMPSRKRYSSSFGKRYAAQSGIASDGSGGSADQKVDRRNSYPYNYEEEDISMFVQAIEAHKPLRGHQRVQSEDMHSLSQHNRETTVTVPAATMATHHRPSGSLDARPFETSTSSSTVDVDEDLRELNRRFTESLAALGTRRRHYSDLGSGSISPHIGGTATAGGGAGDVADARPSPSPRMGGGAVPSRLLPRSGTPSDYGAGSDEVLGRMSLEDKRQYRPP